MKTARAFIALGANLGDARASVLQAIQSLGQLPDTELLKHSSLYRSAPVDASGPDFINAVAEIFTILSPQALLAALQAQEQEAGRLRPYRNAPRTLDLDILLYDGVMLDTPKLVIPHPRMFTRAFVLLPLAEIAPERVRPEQLHAVSGQVIVRIMTLLQEDLDEG
jgi:2-amino-4-hydroxy-6-hydroxymethyldihydropteridine diphosphokinase